MKVFRGKTRWRDLQHSTLGRFFLFTLSMLIIMLLTAAIVTSRSQDALRNEIETRNTLQAADALEQLAISLDRTMYIQRGLLYDKDINRLGVAPSYYTKPQETLAMLSVVDRMFMITTSSPLIRQAYFMVPSIGKTITADGVEPLSDEYYTRCNALCINQSQAFIELDGQFYIMMAYPTYNYYLKEHDASYLLSLQLDTDAVAAFLAAHGLQDNEALYLFNNDGKIITCLNRSGVPFDTDRLFHSAQSQSTADITTEDGARYLVSSVVNTTSAKTLTLVKLQPYAQAFTMLNLQGGFFMALMVLLIIANLAYVAHMWHVIQKPLNKLSAAFAQVEHGNFALRIHHTRKDDFSEIYHQFNQMNAQLEELIEQVYMQTIRTQRAELKQLQAQINPHFLYNNLFMLRSLAQLGDTATIETLSAELGEYFRYVTRVGNQGVPLHAEVSHARHYASIQDMRFSSRITLDFPPLPDAYRDIIVPRLILQPLLENAYQHGLQQTSAHGRLQISYRNDEASLLIVVEDNGTALTDDTLDNLQASMSNLDVQETTGLINIHRRLLHRFGPGYGLAFSRSQLGGLCVTMRIPTAEGSQGNAQSTDRGR